MGIRWSSESSTSQVEESSTNNTSEVDDVEQERKRSREAEMQRFKEEMNRKREARHEAIVSLQKKLRDLQEENERFKSDYDKLKAEMESQGDAEGLIARLKLAEEERDAARAEVEELKNYGNAGLVAEVWRNEEMEGLERQVKALKEVASIGGEMLKIRELQVNELKSKLTAIEETGQAYEKEVENMRRLRNLYEERTRTMTMGHQMEIERERAKLVAAEAKQEMMERQLNLSEEKNKELEERVMALDGSLDTANAEISELKIELAGASEELYNVTSQINMINQLFSQVLSPGPDCLERITRVLEEHRDLVNHLTAKGKINDLASTLLDLADKDHIPNNEGEDMSGHLNKVWRLLIELLGHHVKQVQEDTAPDSCYKSVNTPSGPKLVISVSQTFLRLKDLILEKNNLVKEVGRLKDLNSTLENRLVEQETRLGVVAAELQNTWDVVSKLKVQHKHLHTHEKMLRYELAQKRLMLNELKKQLEDCKDSWALARAKNNKTEEDWRILRSEFASRKQKVSSTESGYEESPTDSQDEEDSWKIKGEKKDISIHSDEEDSWNQNYEESAKTTSEETGKLEQNNEKDLSAPQEGVSFDFSECPNGIKAVAQGPETEEKEPSKPRTAEEILEARQARLQRLEEQCKGLFNKMSQTSQRSDQLSNRLVELHEHFGEDKRLCKREDDSGDPPAKHSSDSDDGLQKQSESQAMKRETTGSDQAEATSVPGYCTSRDTGDPNT